MTAQWEFSPEVIDKAEGYLRDGRIHRDADVHGLYWVQGSARRPYRVQTDASAARGTATWISCSCPHGVNVGAGACTCSHAVAVLLAIRDRIKLEEK